MDFSLKIIKDFTMNIDKLNLATFVGEVMDKIEEFQISCHLQKIIPIGKTGSTYYLNINFRVVIGWVGGNQI